MKDAQVGLQVGRDPDSGIFDVIGRQPHNGNQWLGTFGDVGAKYLGGPDNVDLSEFIVDNDGPGFIPPSWSPVNSGFVTVELGSTNPFYSCPAGLPPGGNLVSDDEDYVKRLLNNQILWGDKLGASGWNARFQVLKAYVRGALSENAVSGVTTWANAPGLSAERSAYYAEEAVAEALGYPGVDEDLAEVLNVRFDSAFVAYAEARIAVERDRLMGTLVSTDELEGLKETLATATTNLEALILQPAYNHTQAIATARRLNNSLGSLEVFEANEKQVNDFVLTLAESGKGALTSALPTIIAIARQCPDVGGTAVFRARGLAAFLGADAAYDDAQTCAKEAKGGAKFNLEATPTPALLVYPNPAVRELNISSGDVAITGFRLKDVFGRVVCEATGNMKEQTTMKRVDVSTCKAGLYVLELQLANGTSVSRKVMIQ